MTTTSKKIGYKKLENGLVAILEIVGENNEERDDIYEKKYAKHRCQKAFVLEIYHADDKDKKEKEGYSFYDYKFVYKVGETVEVDNYDENLNEPCSSGIHYFLTEECARLYRAPFAERNWYTNGRLWWETIPLEEEGYFQHTSWDQVGNVRECGKEKDGKKEGEWVIYHIIGSIRIESRGCFTNDEKVGWWTEWNCDGIKSSESYFVNDIRRSENNYYSNGRLNSERYYDDCLRLHGNYKEWYDNGEVSRVGEYDHALKVGEWTECYRSGSYERVKNYEKGRLNGEYKRYYENGNLKVLGRYKSGKKIGVWTYFNSAEQVRSQKRFGRRIRKTRKVNKIDSQNQLSIKV